MGCAACMVLVVCGCGEHMYILCGCVCCPCGRVSEMVHGALARMRRSLVGMAGRTCSLLRSAAPCVCVSVCVVVFAWCASCVFSECVVVVLRAWCWLCVAVVSICTFCVVVLLLWLLPMWSCV